jgi:hypothetical protein
MVSGRAARTIPIKEILPMSLCADLIPESERDVYRRIHQQWEDQLYRQLFAADPDLEELAIMEFLLGAMEDALPFVKEVPQA